MGLGGPSPPNSAPGLRRGQDWSQCSGHRPQAVKVQTAESKEWGLEAQTGGLGVREDQGTAFPGAPAGWVPSQG